MALKVERQDTWVAGIKNVPGALAAKLTALADAGANLEFVIARRESKKAGVVFVTPIKGAKLVAAAKKAGFAKTKTLHAIRVEGPDRKGAGAAIAQALADAGINLRGISAAAIGKKFVCNIAVDSAADAAKAGRILSKL